MTSQLPSESQVLNADDAWNQAYNNAAERLFPKVDLLTEEQDAQCIAAANEEIASQE